MKWTEGRKLMLAGVAIFVVSAALLWSWNTLAELLDLPSAEFRHAAALLIIASTLRWLARPGYSRHAAYGRGRQESRRSLP